MTTELPDRRSQQIFEVKAILRATPDQAAELADAIGRILCPDQGHPGPCQVQWTTMVRELDGEDDEDDARGWHAFYDEEDQRDVSDLEATGDVPGPGPTEGS